MVTAAVGDHDLRVVVPVHVDDDRVSCRSGVEAALESDNPGWSSNPELDLVAVHDLRTTVALEVEAVEPVA